MIKEIKWLALTGVLLLFTACGGGGGGGAAAPVASTENFPLTTVLANSLLSSANSFSITGTISGIAVTGSGTSTRGSLTSGTFENSPALQRAVTVTGSFNLNGTSYPLNSSYTSWYSSSNVPLGESGGDDYLVVTGTPSIPSTVRVNDTGTLYTANRYPDSNKSYTRGTVTVSYVVEADTASTALLTLIRTHKDISNRIESTSTSQVRITTAGAISHVKDTNIEGADTLTMTYR